MSNFAKTIRRVDIRFRQATARMRTHPDFLILGAPKAGTTSLYDYLSNHPQVSPARTKEVLYFDRSFGYGDRYYRSFFPTNFEIRTKSLLSGKQQITGEASPYYLQHPLVPERVAKVLPNTKFIAVLRDPVERAWSHYRHNVRHGREDLLFEEALDQEEVRAEKDMLRMVEDDRYFAANFLQYSYRRGGLYAEHLERWAQCFDLHTQLKIVKSEELFTNTRACLEEITRFLGIEPVFQETFSARNVGITIDGKPHTVLQNLREVFEPENQRLSQMLGQDFNWSAESL